MFSINKESGNVALEYPRMWTYKVIGADAVALDAAIQNVMVGRDYHLESSNSSSGGKYVSFTVELEVETEQVRNEIFGLLQNHPEVKMVI